LSKVRSSLEDVEVSLEPWQIEPLDLLFLMHYGQE
jgi:hypothetical protein